MSRPRICALSGCGSDQDPAELLQLCESQGRLDALQSLSVVGCCQLYQDSAS